MKANFPAVPSSFEKEAACRCLKLILHDISIILEFFNHSSLSRDLQLIFGIYGAILIQNELAL